jgi:hypothetical protein
MGMCAALDGFHLKYSATKKAKQCAKEKSVVYKVLDGK